MYNCVFQDDVNAWANEKLKPLRDSAIANE